MRFLWLILALAQIIVTAPTSPSSYTMLTMGQQSFTLSVGGGRAIVDCVFVAPGVPDRWDEVKDCKLNEGSSLDEVITAYNKAVKEATDEQKKMIAYDSVCAKWGPWHKRRDERWRACVQQKCVYQSEWLPSISTPALTLDRSITEPKK